MSSYPKLDELLAPHGAEEFFRKTWRKETLYLGDRSGTTGKAVVDIEELDYILNHGPNNLSSADARHARPERVEHSHPEGEPDTEEALNRLQSGATLILDRLHWRSAGLRKLCRELERETNFKFGANVYITPPEGQGFAAHSDDHCVFVLQIYGEKIWRVGTRNAEREGDLSLEREADALELAEAEERRLVPGDLLYIPEGFPHDARTSRCGSVHVTLGFQAPSWSLYLRSLFRDLVDAHEGLDEDIYPGFLGCNRPRFEEEMAEKFRETVESAQWLSVARRHMERVRTRVDEDKGGRLETMLSRREVDEEDRFVAMRNVVMQSAGGEMLEILFSGKSIFLPAYAKGSVEACLSSGEFGLPDMPNDLDDAGKRLLVERLLTEGVLKRCS